MSGDSLPEVPTADDFRALARSSPWRFTTVHFTHRRQRDAGSTPDGEPVEAWLDRRLGRVVVRSSGGVEVAEGPPYGAAVSLVTCDDDAEGAVPSPPSPEPEVALRPDGLVARRPVVLPHRITVVEVPVLRAPGDQTVRAQHHLRLRRRR